MKTDKPRIVIYGCGQYGGFITRLAVDKGWPVVAAFNRAGPKVGQDLGQVVGLERDLGVVIQDCDTASYSDIDADIAIVAQTNMLAVNFAAYERLIGAGLNVLCHGNESYYPWACNKELAQKIDSMAKHQGVSFTGGGIWDMSRIWAGIILLGPCTQVNSLLHRSLTNAGDTEAVTLEQGRQVGIGLTVEEYAKTGLSQSPLPIAYKVNAESVLRRHGYTVTENEAVVEPIVLDAPIKSPWTGEDIPAGHCMGTRIAINTATEEGVTVRSEIDLSLFREGDVEYMSWEVDGLPRTSIRTERKDSAHATSGCLFNRIPDVIAAQPGIVTVSEMGPLMTTGFV